MMTEELLCSIRRSCVLAYIRSAGKTNQTEIMFSARGTLYRKDCRGYYVNIDKERNRGPSTAVA